MICVIGAICLVLVGQDGSSPAILPSFVQVVNPSVLAGEVRFERQPKLSFDTGNVVRYLLPSDERGMVFWVDMTDQRIQSFTGPAGRSALPTPVSDGSTLLLALLRYFHAAGYSDGLRLRAWQIDDQDLRVECDVVRDGILMPWHSTAMFTVDTRSGQLRRFTMDRWPRLDSLEKQPGFTRDGARARIAERALEKLLQLKKQRIEEWVETPSVPVDLRLYWARAASREVEGDWAEALYWAQYTHRPRLAYSTILELGTPDNETMFVAIDAVSGDLIEASVFAGTGHLGEPVRKRGKVGGKGLWDLGQGVTFVSSGNRSKNVPMGDVETTATLKCGEPAHDVIVGRGRWLTRAKFYPGKGMIVRK